MDTQSVAGDRFHMRRSAADSSIMKRLAERYGTDESGLVRFAIRYLDEHGPLPTRTVEPLEPFVELGGRSVGDGTLLVAGAADGRATLIVLPLRQPEHTRAVVEAALAGGRMMRVVHTDRRGTFIMPIPRPLEYLSPSDGRVLDDTEDITLREWCFDHGDPSMVIWAGYGPRSRTWVVLDDGPLTGAQCLDTEASHGTG